MAEDQVAVHGGIWLVQSLTGLLACSPSLIGALRQAYEISARTSSWAEAPSEIVKLGSDERLNAEQIAACWRHIGWPLANSTVVTEINKSSQRARTPTRGYESTREAAMAAFAKSWRRE